MDDREEAQLLLGCSSHFWYCCILILPALCARVSICSTKHTGMQQKLSVLPADCFALASFPNPLLCKPMVSACPGTGFQGEKQHLKLLGITATIWEEEEARRCLAYAA